MVMTNRPTMVTHDEVVHARAAAQSRPKLQKLRCGMIGMKPPQGKKGQPVKLRSINTLQQLNYILAAYQSLPGPVELDKVIDM